MINAETRLVQVLVEAQQYLDLAIQAQDKERESYKRIMELYLNIARELEHLCDQRLGKRKSPAASERGMIDSEN